MPGCWALTQCMLLTFCAGTTAQPDTPISMPAANGNGAVASGNSAASNGIAGLTNGSAMSGRPAVPPKSAAENRWAGVERPYSQVP